MIFEALKPDGLFLIKPKIYGDGRGYFLETFRSETFRNNILKIDFLQDNFSFSKRNALRGLHYQTASAAQAKLIMAVSGTVLDVAVDLRKDSPTFKQHLAVELSCDNHYQLFIPEGFAHGFVVLSDEASIIYKCSAYYNPDFERGIRWDDPELDIDWKTDQPILSDKDKNLPFLNNVDEADLF